MARQGPFRPYDTGVSVEVRSAKGVKPQSPVDIDSVFDNWCTHSTDINTRHGIPGTRRHKCIALCDRYTETIHCAIISCNRYQDREEGVGGRGGEGGEEAGSTRYQGGEGKGRGGGRGSGVGGGGAVEGGRGG